MYIVIFVSVLALILTYLESRKILKGGMKLGFILVTLLAVVHYDYGNDYMSYYKIFNEITSTPFSWYNLVNGYTYKEPLWALINYAFKPFGGFFMMVAVLNIIQNAIYYKFISNNVQQSWWPISVFIYLFSTSYYLLNFSMMRQGLVIAIFVGMWTYIKEKKWWIALLGLIFGSMIHKSSLLLIPFAFWGCINIRNGKIWSIILILTFFILWLADDFLNTVFQAFINLDEFQGYEGYLMETESFEYGIGFMINMLPFVVSLYYLMVDRKSSYYNNHLVVLATLGYMMLPFNQILPHIGRIGMYFNVFSIAAFTIAYNSIKIRTIKYVLVSIFILMMLYDYWLFFTNSVFSKYYSTFYTIFSAL